MATWSGVEPKRRAISGTAGATMVAFNWYAMTLSTREATMGQVFRPLAPGQDSGALSSGRSAIALIMFG
jgi:hypothetical protein